MNGKKHDIDEIHSAEIHYYQNPTYVAAVKELRNEYVVETFTIKKENTHETIQSMLEKGPLDYDEFKKCIKNSSSQDSARINNSSGSFTSSSQQSTSGNLTGASRQRNILIKKIESVVADVLKDVANGEHPKLILRNQKIWSNCLFKEKISLKTVQDAQMMTVNFASSNSREKFSLLIHLLSVIKLMLLKQSTCTRRELYYQNVHRVKNQSAIDSAVRDICCLLQTPPWDLGLLATSKGLIAGPLTMKNSAGNTISCMDAGGVLIPQDINSLFSIESSARFVLVVEKDATFQKLLDEGAMLRLGPFILITGKGYPDVNTRLMLKLLVDTLKIPALALMDADPHGIEIMCTYRYGSLAMSHLSEKLAVPSLRWLGIHPSDITALGAPSLPLTSKDGSKLQDLLNRPYCATNAPLRQQIETLTSGGCKTEIEGIGTMSQAYLTDSYIPHKIIAKDFV